ncbi:DUF4177 domain-containing protein [Enterococcus sp. AZ109]|uniref:DUF4177 domain-containing protein n=1 Tax=Enterococcus sp. AZ109 TaxID=2774634 RepID=UPI003F27870E
MKNYEFVTVTPTNKGVVSGELVEHRQIIVKYAEKGYRFIAAIPIEINANGYPRKFDLVFEK